MKSKQPQTNEVETSGGISVQEAGRRGGTATLEKQGVNFFREIGRKGGRRTAELYGDLLREFAKRGGRPRRPALNTGEGNHNRKEATCGRPSGSPLPS